MMPKVNSQRARKQYNCEKCDVIIPIGAMYLRWCSRISGNHISCMNCKPTPEELKENIMETPDTESKLI